MAGNQDLVLQLEMLRERRRILELEAAARETERRTIEAKIEYFKLTNGRTAASPSAQLPQHAQQASPLVGQPFDLFAIPQSLPSQQNYSTISTIPTTASLAVTSGPASSGSSASSTAAAATEPFGIGLQTPSPDQGFLDLMRSLGLPAPSFDGQQQQQHQHQHHAPLPLESALTANLFPNTADDEAFLAAFSGAGAGAGVGGGPQGQQKSVHENATGMAGAGAAAAVLPSPMPTPGMAVDRHDEEEDEEEEEEEEEEEHRASSSSKRSGGAGGRRRSTTGGAQGGGSVGGTRKRKSVKELTCQCRQCGNTMAIVYVTCPPSTTAAAADGDSADAASSSISSASSSSGFSVAALCSSCCGEKSGAAKVMGKKRKKGKGSIWDDFDAGEGSRMASILGQDAMEVECRLCTLRLGIGSVVVEGGGAKEGVGIDVICTKCFSEF
ncbi:hypothetical protein HK101_003864, partial [Irineochytrium annulatum]